MCGMIADRRGIKRDLLILNELSKGPALTIEVARMLKIPLRNASASLGQMFFEGIIGREEFTRERHGKIGCRHTFVYHHK